MILLKMVLTIAQLVTLTVGITIATVIWFFTFPVDIYKEHKNTKSFKNALVNELDAVNKATDRLFATIGNNIIKIWSS